MNFFKKLIYSLYQYYSEGATKDIPYEKTIFVLLGFISFNIFSICLLIVPYDSLRISLAGYGKLLRVSFFAIIIVIYYIIMRLIIPENKIKELHKYKNGYKKYVVGFFCYALLSFLIFVFLVFFIAGK